jgi:hypothetical protein
VKKTSEEIGRDIALTDDDFRVLSGSALAVDPWVASSLMQKAIRRGEVEYAQRAALTFNRQRGAAVWRRLTVVAFEDVGVASADALVVTTIAATSPFWRGRVGEREAIAGIVRLLAEAPKDRSSDHLIFAAKEHPSLESIREMVGSSSLDRRLEMLITDLPLAARAIAAWFCSGVEWGDEHRLDGGDLPRLMSTFRGLGVPAPVLEATRNAAARTREPITIMIPLIWLAAAEDGPPNILAHQVPPTPVLNGVPLYAFDTHTALGKMAISRFAKENEPVREALAQHVPEHKAQRAACVAAFYADAAPVARRFAWSQSAALESLGIETDMHVAGVPSAGVAPILTAVKENLGHLNAIRAELLCGVRQ